MNARSLGPQSLPRLAFSGLAALSLFLTFCTGGSGDGARSGAAGLSGTLAVAFGFGEGAGTTTADASGNANNGTLHGATWTTQGKYGDALAFGGASYVSVPAGANTNDLVPFTYCAWIFPLDMGGQNDGRILHKGSNTARKQLQFDSSTTNGLGLYVDRATSVAQAISANNAVPLSQWSYVCGTYSESDGPRLYRNGVEATYASRNVGSGTTTSDAVDALYIGNRSTADKGFHGTIDEVRVYDRVLTTTEMQTDMNTPIGGGADAGADSGTDTGGGGDSGGGDTGGGDTGGGDTGADSGAGDASCTGTVTMGDTRVLTSADNGNANLLVAQQATLSQAATTQTLSFYVTQAAGKLRLGLYDSTGPSGGPGAKIGETAEITPAAGWNTASVLSPSSLPAGTYWLAYLPSDNNLGFLKTQDGTSSGRDYTFAYGTLPSTFSTSPASTASHWSFYATLTTCSGGTITVSVSPRAAGVTLSQPEQFTATVQGSSNTQVTWAVDGVSGGNTSVGTISSAGLYTPPSAAGAHTVKATSVADTTKSASATVAVTDFAGVLTWHDDVSRTGQNLRELALTPSNVNQSQFGKVFSQAIDGFTYAQPLWVPGVAIAGGTHNVVYVATENNSVYAFDADASQAMLWHVSLGTPVPAADTGDTSDLIPQLGITGTPVIDPASRTLYVAAETKDSGPTYHHRLHALDLATGAEKFGGPVVINPSVPGTGGNSSGGNIQFSPIDHFQRPALLLQGGVVYVAIGSSADTNPGVSHGWIVGFNASTLAEVMAYSPSPNGTMASIWQAGAGIAADSSGNMYVETGNGTFDANTGGVDLGDSAIKVSTTGAVLDWFTPYNQSTLDANDIDLGSAGPIVLPDQPGAVPHELIATGKPGILYVLNRDNMGHYQSGSNSQIVQSVAFATNTTNVTGGSYATLAYFNGNVYFGDVGTPGDGKLKAYHLTSGLLSTSPTSEAPTAYTYPGATPSVSANGTSSGIVWAIEGQGYTPVTSPVLHAYDASNLGSELYNSEQAGSRDRPGPAVKFVVPTVANGKVYVATQTDLTVYGLLP